MNVELRPWTRDDLDWGFDVHRLALGPYVAATWGWDDAEQRKAWDQREGRTREAILVDGKPAGFFSAEERETEFWINNVELHPDYQRQGIGGALVRDVIARAEAAAKPVGLRVLRVNPARRLYERLGFTVVEETETHFIMRRQALPAVRDAGANS